MDDLISRQAAIDAINALHDKPNAWLDCAVDAVMALPSAQPERTCETCRYNNRTWDMEPFESCTIGGKDSHYEPSAHPEIIRCKDCKYWREYKYVRGKPKYSPYCGFNATHFRKDDFCSHAERREE